MSYLRLCMMFLSLAFSGQALSEEPATTSVTGELSKSASPSKEPSVSESYAAQQASLESLRYKHLWIAYGLIWLIVFVFLLRTYKLGQSNEASLEALKQRLSQLEAKDE